MAKVVYSRPNVALVYQIVRSQRKRTKRSSQAGLLLILVGRISIDVCSSRCATSARSRCGVARSTNDMVISTPSSGQQGDYEFWPRIALTGVFSAYRRRASICCPQALSSMAITGSPSANPDCTQSLLTEEPGKSASCQRLFPCTCGPPCSCFGPPDRRLPPHSTGNVINDCGADVAGLISFPDKRHQITYIRHNTSRDRSAARNSGIKIARGKYLAHFDDDDIFHSQSH